MMTAGEKLKVLMDRKEITKAEMAEATGQSRQNLSNKLRRDNFTETEIRDMAKVLGYTINVQFLDENGNVVL